MGERAAEHMAELIGSWRFLIIQSCLLVFWVLWNTFAVITLRWDQPPYIGLNLMLSFQAAYTGPILLIAANVAARRDRAQANRDTALLEQLTALVEQVERLEERELVVLTQEAIS